MPAMPAASMKQLLESGVHFGHQTRRWNPKMKPFIFTERGGIHIIDLQKTQRLLDTAYDFAQNIVERGGTVMFVGTKKQCQDIIKEESERVGMPYVSHRWLGGLLTNFSTIHGRIRRLHELRRMKEDGSLDVLPTKERMNMERELEKLEVNLGGVANLDSLPDAVFIIDPKREEIATREVNKLGIPLIGLVDTNCDPDEVDYIIPGNDDAIRSCNLIIKTLTRAVEESKQRVSIEEMQPKKSQEPAPAAEPEAGAEAPAQAQPGRREQSKEKKSEPRKPRVSEAARRAAERKSPRAAQPKPGAKAQPEVVAPEGGETPGEPAGATEVVAPEQADDAQERRTAEAGDPGTAQQELEEVAEQTAEETAEQTADADTGADVAEGSEAETADEAEGSPESTEQ